MMGKHKSKFIAFSLLLTLLLTTLPQSSSQALSLSESEQVNLIRFGRGTIPEMVKDWLMKSFPNYSDSAPSHTIGALDLNGDEAPEIIVRIDDEYNFCDENFWCDTYVFVYQNTSLIEVAKFKSGKDIRATFDTTNNIRNLLVDRTDGRYDLYSWSKNKYVKVTK